MADDIDTERELTQDDFTDEDRRALGWAVSAESPTGLVVAERVRAGGKGVTRLDLRTIMDEWDAAARPAPERHVHRTRVTFADGTAITAVSFLGDDPYARQVAPAFGLYLDERWKPPWPYEHVDWPDFGVPADASLLSASLRALLDRARAGGVVEIGCLGGHGRTGTALAFLAVLTGTPPDDAVEWVRTNYCAKAVETDAQAAFVATLAP